MSCFDKYLQKDFIEMQARKGPVGGDCTTDI